MGRFQAILAHLPFFLFSQMGTGEISKGTYSFLIFGEDLSDNLYSLHLFRPGVGRLTQFGDSCSLVLLPTGGGWGG